METFREIELCEAAPFMFGENRHLGVTDGASVWIVVVTCEAMGATATPPTRRSSAFEGVDFRKGPHRSVGHEPPRYSVARLCPDLSAAA
jgi:hypothetical protein